MKFFNTLLGRYTLVIFGVAIQTPLFVGATQALSLEMLLMPEVALAAIAFLVAYLALLWGMLNFLPEKPASLSLRLADVGPTGAGVVGCLLLISATNSMSNLWVGVVMICVAAIFAMSATLVKLMQSTHTNPTD